MRQTELRERIENLNSLPTLPTIATELIQIASNEKADLKAVANLIEKDPSLASRILRFANSAHFGLQSPVKTICRALSLLGLPLARNLALSMKVFDLFNSRKYPEPQLLIDLWTHSIATAMIADRLARRCGCPRPDEAFLAGLLHDIGKAVLFDQIPKAYSEVCLQARNESVPVHLMENRLLGCTHTETGQWAIEKWRFPGSLAEVIRQHHGDLTRENPAESILLLVQAADQLCHLYAIGTPLQATSLGPDTIPLDVSTLSSVLGLSPEDLDEIVSLVLERMQEVGPIVGIRPDTRQMYLKAAQSANGALQRMSRQLDETLLQLERQNRLVSAFQHLSTDVHPDATPVEAAKEIAQAVQIGLAGGPVLCLLINEERGVLEGSIAEGSFVSPIEIFLPSKKAPSEESLIKVMRILALGRTSRLRFDRRIHAAFRSAKILDAPLRRGARTFGRILATAGSSLSDADWTQRTLSQIATHASRCLDQTWLYRALEDQSDKLARIEHLASLGRQAAETAHEINTPLAVISGKAELLLQRVEDTSAREELRAVSEQVGRISRMARSLLTLARRPEDPCLQLVSLPALVEQCLGLIQDRVANPKVKVLQHYDSNLPIITVDPDQLAQVLLNLILNAYQAMPGGGTLKIAACAPAPGTCVKLTVADTGRGIAEEQIEAIFDPFFTTKETGEGTGLGLSICRRIINNHNGEIDVTSAAGRGAAFTLTLPVRQTVSNEPPKLEPAFRRPPLTRLPRTLSPAGREVLRQTA